MNTVGVITKPLGLALREDLATLGPPRGGTPAG